MYLGQNTLQPAAAGRLITDASMSRMPIETLPLTIEAGAMQSVRPEEYASGMATVGPAAPDCPPCPPPRIIYRDRIVEKKVLVPGPTVFVDRAGPTQYIHVPGGSMQLPGAGYSSLPGAGAAYATVPPGSAAANKPEPSPEDWTGATPLFEGSRAGELRSTGKFPWWLVLVGAGVMYTMMMRRKV